MSGIAKKLLSAEALERAAKAFEALAKRQNVTCAIAGGYALQFYGSTRLTVDLDMVTDTFPSGLPLQGTLSFGGFETEIADVPVDVIVRADDYKDLYEAALAARWHVSELPAPLIPIEYIAAMKMVAGRKKDDVDLEWIVTEAKAFDMRLAQQIMRRFLGAYGQKEFDAFAAEAKWRAKREH